VQGYYTALLEDACGALTVQEHDATLDTFRVFYGPVLRVEALATLWDVVPARAEA